MKDILTRKHVQIQEDHNLKMISILASLTINNVLRDPQTEAVSLQLFDRVMATPVRAA